MKNRLLFLTLFTLAFNQHFSIDIEETGESTLFIFQDSISSLDIGDELGLYDMNAIIDSNGAVGELLVGAGVWDGEQLNITTIISQDLSQFGGPMLPGSIIGNSMALKIWDSSNNLEQEATYALGSGTGTFNGLFSVIENVDFDNNGNGSSITDGCDLPDNNFYISGNELLYNSTDDIAGFQFNVDGSTVSSTTGGAAAAAGFTVQSSGNVVIGFSFTGSVVPTGCGVLLNMSFDGNPDGLSNIIVSDASGGSLEFVYYEGGGDDGGCDDEDGDGICDDVDDCVGEYDECDVCNGGGIADGACDCDGNVEDCAGDCGGSACKQKVN